MQHLRGSRPPSSVSCHWPKPQVGTADMRWEDWRPSSPPTGSPPHGSCPACPPAHNTVAPRPPNGCPSSEIRCRQRSSTPPAHAFVSPEAQQLYLYEQALGSNTGAKQRATNSLGFWFTVGGLLAGKTASEE